MRESKAQWKNYLWQSFLAIAAMFCVLAILSLERAIVVTSVAATAFIVFMKPHNPFAAPRNVLGGHMVGLVLGLLFAALPRPSPTIYHVWCATAVGCTMVAMALVDAEHPPAAGTALSVVLAGVSWRVVAAVVTSAVLMALAHHLLRRHMRDL
jgi:CBS-domain-containing membrane protein